MPLANSKKGARAITKFQREAVSPALAQLLHNEQVTQAKIAELERAMFHANLDIKAFTFKTKGSAWQRFMLVLRGAR